MMMNSFTAVSSRHSPSASTVRIGDAVCDLRSCLLEIDGRSHRLEPRLAGVLDLLVRRAGSPVTRDEFLETVWDEDGSDEALNQAISRLRRLLGQADLIVTLPRVGYRLSAEAGPAALAGWPAASKPSLSLPSILSGLDSRSFLVGFIAACLFCGLLYLVSGGRSVEREFEFLTLDPPAAAAVQPSAATDR